MDGPLMCASRGKAELEYFEVRFANWVTGPGGRFDFAGNGAGSFTSIYAPRLTGNPNLEVTISDNPNLTSVDLCALMEAFEIDIFDNENLVGISIPVLETSSNGFQVFNNPSLQTLCAPNLEDGGDVCIGDESNQPSLDADLSSLVTGSFAGFSPCYGRTDPHTNQLNAEKVCGKEGNGLFSDFGCPSAGCPETP
ncbi:hypothetical protein PPROV_000524000 [Pycnococcus provasolii]|uniref:Uncharacterized protein n=1 Tax=Pycnococcus provasolii TaxID=41880 RepID=A0A830HI72_9CHLO|nr:hypothetical protein PPROV_000524000 [Pycnococcus provasolii]